MRIPVHEMPVEITSVATLMTEVQLLHDRYRAPIWLRGHGDYHGKLQPTVGREQSFLGEKVTLNPRQEKRLLHQFRRYAHAEWERKLDEWEALFLARHHGLPVRIMDWTANPLVALYFAAEFQRLPAVDGAV
ncbi:MAG: FRG domain-containing protein [bacterium]|jgi:type I restriction enzyme M protein